MGDQGELEFREERKAPKRGRRRWSWLLRNVFRADVESCIKCGGPMRWEAAATERKTIERLIAAHGLGPAPPERSTEPRRGSGWPAAAEQLSFGW
jgi:hypothetical protein